MSDFNMALFVKLNPAIKYVTSPIIFTAARMETLANHYVFEPLGLTSATARILILLKCGDTMNSSKLLGKTGCGKSNISQRIRLLEKKGLIKRLNGDRPDKRIIKLEITKNGEKKLEKIASQFKKYSLTLEKHFQAEEMEINYNFFKKINKVFDNLENKLNKK